MQKCYCGFNSFTKFITKDFFYNAKYEYEYRICLNCKSFYLLNAEKVRHNYNENYYSIVKSPNPRSNFLQIIRYNSNSIFAKILRFIRPISKYDEIITQFLITNNSSVLDFGSGSSFYIKYLNSLNILKKESFSFDPYSRDPQTIRILNEIPFKKIDLIISNQAFEHLPNPQQQLDELYDLSNSNCNLIFSVPVVGSVLEQFMEYSYTLQAPDHITILSLHAWIKLIIDTKWKIESISEDHMSQANYYSNSIKLFKKYNLKSKIDKSIGNKVDNIIFHLKKH